VAKLHSLANHHGLIDMMRGTISLNGSFVTVQSMLQKFLTNAYS